MTRAPQLSAFLSIAGAVCLVLTLGPWPARCWAQAAPRRISSDATPGVKTFTPQRWGIVGVTLVNPTDRAADILSAHSFANDPTVQFARQLWVPERALRQAWYPMLPPKDVPRGAQLKLNALLLDRTAGRELLLRDDLQGSLIAGGLLRARGKDPVTGMLDDPEDPDGWLLAQVALAAFGWSTSVDPLFGDLLPPTPESLQGLDYLFVASDRPAADPAGIAAIRAWLHAGGRLWVSLERVSPATVALLLGEDFPCTQVDRVDLTRWQFRKDRPSADPDDEVYDAPVDAAEAQRMQAGGMVRGFEPPVEMVRMLVPGVRPVHSLDGWPASFWRRSGRGLVLFTTVGPRGWVVPRGPGDKLDKLDKARQDPGSPIAGVKETASLNELALAFFKPRDEPTLRPQAFAPLVAGQVGYRVVGRGLVLALLALFCTALAAAGWWLWRRGDLAHLGWIGPCAAVGTGLVLVLVGSQGRVPATAAIAQLVEVAPHTHDASVTGLIALYNPGGAFEPLGAERGGVFLPDRKVQGGATRRMVWTDLDRWHWENLGLPPGLHLAPLEASARIDEPMSVRLTFGTDGAVGKVRLGPFTAPADALLALPSRRHLGVRFQNAGGAFTAGPDDQLAPGQFLGSGLLTDEQGRRREIYRKLLDQPVWPRYPQRPMFLTWAPALDLGFSFPEGTRRTGSALVAIPLDFDRPAPGTQVTIPAPFLAYKSLTGEGLALLYDQNHNTWVSARSQPSRTQLRFQVPTVLLPLTVQHAVLEIDVTAPSRTLTIVGAGKNEVLATRSSPVGRFRIPFDRLDLLQPDGSGGIRLGLAISDAAEPSTLWKINDLQLDLKGVTR